MIVRIIEIWFYKNEIHFVFKSSSTMIKPIINTEITKGFNPSIPY